MAIRSSRARSVNDLLVENPTDKPVLLYEGEEVLGAQQNRTFDVTVLVAAGAQAAVPVSCVEAGRWDGAATPRTSSRAAGRLPRAAPRKNRAGARAGRAGLEARADAERGLERVDRKVARARASLAHRRDARRLRGPARPARTRSATRSSSTTASSASLVAIGGQFAVLDYVSRPDVFAVLHGPLVQGYALDALEATTPTALDRRGARLRLARDRARAERRRDAIGLGRELRFARTESRAPVSSTTAS